MHHFMFVQNKDMLFLFWQSKIEMLDNLLEIEVAYSMLKSGDGGGKDPIDVHYEQLKTEIKVEYLKPIYR